MSPPVSQPANHLYVPITQFVTEQTDIGALIRTHFGGDEARDQNECQQNDGDVVPRKVSQFENSNKTSTDIDSCDHISYISRTQIDSRLATESRVPESTESSQHRLNAHSHQEPNDEHVTSQSKGYASEKRNKDTDKNVLENKSFSRGTHHGSTLAFSSQAIAQNTCHQSTHTLLTGLHTCGDLAANVLRVFTCSPHVQVVCSIGCCYHMIYEHFLKTPFDPTGMY